MKNLRPKMYYFAKQGLEGYAKRDEPNIFLHAFEPMVKRADLEVIVESYKQDRRRLRELLDVGRLDAALELLREEPVQVTLLPEHETFPVRHDRQYDKPFPREIPRATAEMIHRVFLLKTGSQGKPLYAIERAGGFTPDEMTNIFPQWAEHADEIMRLRAYGVRADEEIRELKEKLENEEGYF